MVFFKKKYNKILGKQMKKKFLFTHLFLVFSFSAFNTSNIPWNQKIEHMLPFILSAKRIPNYKVPKHIQKFIGKNIYDPNAVFLNKKFKEYFNEICIRTKDF